MIMVKIRVQKYAQFILASLSELWIWDQTQKTVNRQWQARSMKLTCGLDCAPQS